MSLLKKQEVLFTGLRDAARNAGQGVKQVFLNAAYSLGGDGDYYDPARNVGLRAGAATLALDVAKISAETSQAVLRAGRAAFRA